MLSRISILAALAILLPACEMVVPGGSGQPADAEAGEVEMELAGPQEGVMLVPVYLNGEGPFDFVFDTGATLTCLSGDLAGRLDPPEIQGVDAVGVGVGGAGAVQLVRLDSVRVGTASATEMTACVLDLAHVRIPGVQVDGLLGLNFLRPFLIEIDFERRVVTLE